MIRWIRIALCISALPLLFTASAAQPVTEVGRYPLTQFAVEDYEAHVQNWAARRLPNGLMVFANTSGVLVFDGTRWETIAMPNASLVRSLAQDSSGRVYVGAQGEFGYLAPDSLGALQYISLIPHVPENARAFENVWSTAHTPQGVYFQTNAFLFRWSPATETLTTWRSQTHFAHAFSIRDTLYVAEAETGLLRLDTVSDTLTPLPGTDALGAARTTVGLPLGTRGLLIGTMEGGLYRYDGARLRPFATSANAYLRAHRLYRGIQLPGGGFAFATLRGGALLLRADGTVARIVDEADGLRDNTVTNLFADPARGHLWLTLNDGIARMDWPAPFTAFSEASGLPGIVEGIIRHRGRIYAATNRGIFVVAPTPRHAARFTPVANVSSNCHELLSTAHGLLAGCGDGLYRIRGTTATHLFEGPAIRTLHPAPHDTTLMLAGDMEGLRRFRFRQGRWMDAGRVVEIAGRISAMTFAPDDALWLSLWPQGVARVEDVATAAPVVTRFPPGERGLPTGVVNLAQGTDRPLFLAESGLYRFDPGDVDDNGTFQPAAQFGPLFATTPDGEPGRSVLAARTDAQDNLWMFAWPDVGVVRRQADGTFRWDAAPFHRARMPFVYAFHFDPDGTVWFGGTEGIVRYEPRQAVPLPAPVPALVRRMTPVDNGTLWYAGPSAHQPTLPFTANAVRFTFALPSYHADTHRYQVRLDGFDYSWSEWTTETRKDYTNLPPGTYTFRVRGEDAFGRTSPEGTVTFTVHPPWYRTTWAYLLWSGLGLALVGGIGYGTARWRTQQLEARSRKLERLVQRRTAEVHRQNTQLEAQAERLAELDAAKSRFFANLSHEFRTPITLILGPIEDLLARASKDERNAETLRLVHRNASRMLRLINQLLDLAKLEAGHMRLEAARTNAAAFLRSITRAFLPLAERRAVDLAFTAAEDRDETLLLYADRDKLEKIMANLLSNAFKATPSGGRIDVHLRREDEHASIVVEDTGRGIPPDELATIFDRFQQHDAASIEPGTGIGLNLVKEFVELHGGTVMVDSTSGEGTRFTVRLPLGRDHLRDEDIVEAPPVASVEEVPSGGASPSPEAPAEANGEVPAASAEDVPTLLIVDDNPDIRAYVRTQVEARYRVAEAADGVEGLARAEAVLPDCIIADVMMPRMDGYAFSKALKAHPDLDHIPLILLTAKADSAHRIEGLETGADDYLTKPFNAQELITRVKNLIASRHRLREKFRQTVVLEPSEVDVEAADAVFLRQVRDVVETHLTDPNFSVEQLADAVALSISQLQRKSKALTDQTPVQLIRAMRLERAAQLLDQEAGTITEIAYAVGFNSYAHFARSFKQHFGQSASEYRENTA